MGIFNILRGKKRHATIAGLAALYLAACQGPLGSSEDRSSNGETAALSVSFSVPSSRTVIASSEDFAASIRTLAVAIVNGSGATVDEASGIAYGPNVVHTFGSLIPGAYTVKVNALDAANALIATGSSPVTVAANSNKNVTVNLAFGQSASTGDLSLKLSWPVSTGLGYVEYKVDNAAIAVPAVTADTDNADNHAATLTATDLSGGAHLLYVYFRTSAGSTISVGPFVEAVNIWDGVTSACWIGASGEPVKTRTFDASEFSSSNADLDGLSFTRATLVGTFDKSNTSYTLTDITNSTFSFEAQTANGSKDVAYVWNASGQTWSVPGAPNFISKELGWIIGSNTLQIIVTAPDRYTKKIYTVTAAIANSTGVAIGIPTAAYLPLTFADTTPSILQGASVNFQTSNATLAAVTSGWTWYIDGVAQAGTSSILTLDTGSTATMLGSYFIAARVTYAGVTYTGGFILTVRRLF